MNAYFPDGWVVIKIHISNTNETIYKLFGSWAGGYIAGDSWRLNSGITHITVEENQINFHGSSGSIYVCQLAGYNHLSSYNQSVLNSIIDPATVNDNIKVIVFDTADDFLKDFNEHRQ